MPWGKYHMAFKEFSPKQKLAKKLLGGDRRHILLRGGSRSGKTYILCWAMIQRAISASNSNHAVFRRYAVSARASLWKGTLRQVLQDCFPHLLETTKFNETEMTMTFSNGATISVMGLDDASRVQKVLGLEFVTIWINEATELNWSSISVLLTRLSQRVEVDANGLTQRLMRPKFYVDLNPSGTRHWAHDMFIKKVKPGTLETWSEPDNYAEMQINPADNATNIDANYIASLNELSSKDRTRFLDGEWQNEVDGALFSQSNIDANRRSSDNLPEMVRIVVAVDPAMSSGDKADATGIVVVGKGIDDRGYVLADRSVEGATPEAWAKIVIAAYEEFGADRVIAERNAGGELVESVLRNVEANVSYKSLWSSKGKSARAEPVSALYERDMISHVGDLRELEAELCSLTSGFSVSKAGFSPDRADAVVHGFTELFMGKAPGKIATVAVTGW